jgi:uncharacterized membrane protein YphA (DoxX/SURF4 family)
MSIPLPPSMVSKSKPVRMLAAIAAGFTALAGGLPLIPGVPAWLGAAVALVGIVITAAVSVYTGQSVTPWEDVAVKATPDGRLVMGPAATNAPNGASARVYAVGGQVVPGSATIAAGTGPKAAETPMEGGPL